MTVGQCHFVHNKCVVFGHISCHKNILITNWVINTLHANYCSYQLRRVTAECEYTKLLYHLNICHRFVGKTTLRHFTSTKTKSVSIRMTVCVFCCLTCQKLAIFKLKFDIRWKLERNLNAFLEETVHFLHFQKS
jgi:N-formylglutamate amidohydrolase